MYRSIGKLGRSPTTLLVCDMQERFQPLIQNMDTVMNSCKYMINVATALDIPIVVTQQYTKVFGPTISDIFPSPEIQSKIKVYEKKSFSMITDEVRYVLQSDGRPRSYILVGIEAHVCVQQTCLDLLSMKSADVHVVADGISSQRLYDRNIAIERMRSSGAHITTAQSAAYMLMGTADHPQFKAITQFTKDHMAGPNEF
jgi:nicotinamidase-related amidase